MTNTDEHGSGKMGTDSEMKDEGTRLIDGDLTRQIIGAAMSVHNELGSGFLEKVYENALAIELRSLGLVVEQQNSIVVRYKGQIVGEYVADFVVAERVLIELKTADQLADAHSAQTLNYLRATGLKVGLLINFGGRRLDWKRFVS